MKKVMMLLIVGTVLVSAVPSLWATDPQIIVQAAVPTPSWFSYLLELFR